MIKQCVVKALIELSNLRHEHSEAALRARHRIKIDERQQLNAVRDVRLSTDQFLQCGRSGASTIDDAISECHCEQRRRQLVA